jgi:hypothetical protein
MWHALPKSDFNWGSLPMGWTSETQPTEFAGPLFSHTTLGFYITSGWSRFGLVLPHWFPVLLTALLATVPWLRWRFSLRTLLIAITLVAVGLGVIVAFGR